MTYLRPRDAGSTFVVLLNHESIFVPSGHLSAMALMEKKKTAAAKSVRMKKLLCMIESGSDFVSLH